MNPSEEQLDRLGIVDGVLSAWGLVFGSWFLVQGSKFKVKIKVKV